MAFKLHDIGKAKLRQDTDKDDSASGAKVTVQWLQKAYGLVESSEDAESAELKVCVVGVFRPVTNYIVMQISILRSLGPTRLFKHDTQLTIVLQLEHTSSPPPKFLRISLARR